MRAFRAVDHDAPDECSVYVVFAQDEKGALGCLNEFIPIGYVDIEPLPEWDRYVPVGLESAMVCEDGATLLALGIVPYGWFECRGCDAVGPWDEWELCGACRAAEAEAAEEAGK